MRILKVTTVAVAMTLVVTGCGGLGAGGGDGQAGSGALTTMGFGLGDEVATTRVEAFKREHPDVTLNIVEGGFDEQQFLSAVASGNPPDLVYLSRDAVGTYAARGSILPLTDCIDEHDIDMAAYRPAAVAQVTLDDTVYGIPEFFSTRVVYVNEAVLQQAGVGPEQLDMSDWAGLSAVATKLSTTRGGRLTRIGLDPKIPEFLPLWAKANGVELLSADGRTPNLDDPKVVEALKVTHALIQAQGGWGRFKSFRDTFDFFGAENPLKQNQIAAWPMEEWFLNQAAKNSPDAQLLVKPFVDRQGQPLTYAGGQAWAIPKGAKNPDAACRFAKTLTLTQTWVEAAEARLAARKAEGLPFTGVYTGNAEADEQIFTQLYEPSGNPRFDQAVEVIRSVQDVAFAMPASPAGAEVEKAWLDAVNRVLSGQEEPAAALARAQREATEAIERAAG